MARDPEKRIELIDHLAELRTRLIRCGVYVAVGTVITWAFFTQIFSIVLRPANTVLSLHHSKFLFTSFPEAFMVQLQICVISAMIIVAPFLTFEIWGFISPGLTKEEKRPLRWIVPLSIVLFACGVLLCYWIMQFAFRWFYSYVPVWAELRPSVKGTVIFTLAMLGIFGVLFELPVFLMTLAKIGIINSKLLKEQWRYAVVGIVALAAIATPSNDAFTMISAAVPMLILYPVSIQLVKLVEKKPKKE